jgi:AraC-like DNA-binding protein
VFLVFNAFEKVADEAVSAEISEKELIVVIDAGHGGIEYINTFSSNKKIVEILDFLNKNLTNRISIDELADKFYMSRYHLMHTFKEETGCTIGSYITTKRLLLARDMIRDGSSVSAACDACGFGSYSSFIRAYRKQFHSTPTNT